MVYHPKSGGLPPSVARNSNSGPYNGPKKGAPFGFHFYEDLPSGKKKKVGMFRVNKGEKNVPFMFLDVAAVEDGPQPSIRVHDGFKYNNSFGNIAICNSYHSEGCAMDKALETEHRCFPSCSNPCERKGTLQPVKGGWRWVATGIKMKPFTYTRGPMKGKTVKYQRCMILVTDRDNQYATFQGFREAYEEDGGLRGYTFNVSRSEDPRSSKIGTTWIPIKRMSDAEMMEKFEEAAADYGLPVEQFIQPFDYEKVLQELSTEEMNSAAAHVARERGVNLDGETERAPESAPSIAEDEVEIPF